MRIEEFTGIVATLTVLGIFLNFAVIKNLYSSIFTYPAIMSSGEISPTANQSIECCDSISFDEVI